MGRRRAMALRRRRRQVGVSTRNAPIRARTARASCRRARQQGAASRARGPRTATRRRSRRSCWKRTAAATAPDRRARARRRLRSVARSLLPVRRMATPRKAADRQIERHAHAANTSDAPRRARDADRRRAGARRPLHRSLRNARAKRRGRAATRGSTRQRSCRLPFDAPKTSAPTGLLPPGCRDNARAPS